MHKQFIIFDDAAKKLLMVKRNFGRIGDNKDDNNA